MVAKNKPGMLCENRVLMTAHRENVLIFYSTFCIFFFEFTISSIYGLELIQFFFFFVGHAAQRQVDSENLTLSSTCTKIKKLYSLVSSLSPYAPLASSLF